MISHLGTSLRVTIVSVILLGLIYPLVMTASRAGDLSVASQGLARHNQRQDGRLRDRRAALDKTAVLSRPAVGRRQRLRSDRNRRNELWTDVEEADRFDQSDDRRAGEGESRCERVAANGFSNVQRQRHRPGHHAGGSVLASAARREGATNEPCGGSMRSSHGTCGVERSAF